MTVSARDQGFWQGFVGCNFSSGSYERCRINRCMMVFSAVFAYTYLKALGLVVPDSLGLLILDRLHDFFFHMI